MTTHSKLDNTLDLTQLRVLKLNINVYGIIPSYRKITNRKKNASSCLDFYSFVE